MPIAYSTNGGSRFSATFRHNPYCLIDPTCLNPFGGGTDGVDRGFLGSSDRTKSIRGFALPNYLLFLTCCSLVAVAIQWWVKRARVRLVAVLCVYVWAWLEVNRWFAAIMIYQYANSGADYLDWLLQHLAVDVVSIGTIWLAVRTARRQLKSRHM